MIFVDVPKHWHFVCSQGGGRNVKVMLDLFGLREARLASAGNRISDVAPTWAGRRSAAGQRFFYRPLIGSLRRCPRFGDLRPP